MQKHPYATIDEYIMMVPPSLQPVVKELRSIIKQNAPNASEKISYGMPTFYLNGNLIHFAVQKNHIGLYPTPSGIAAFATEFEKAGYKYSKGAVQFPMTAVLPWDLIARIVKFRVEENTR